MNAILSFFNSTHKSDLTPDQQEFIISLFKKEFFDKKSTIFLNGEINTKHYFVQKGLLRMYIIDTSGKEFNILFAKENQVLGDLASPKPTIFNLDTIEDSVVYSITNDNLNKLREKISDEFTLDSNSRLKKSYIFLQKRLVSILSHTAEENYIELRDNYPDLLQRLPQYHIASYLGVSAEFLSKIIARTTKK
jgi:CRP-like cAMP-binding protein